MRKVRIVCVGNTKDDYIKTGCGIYQKRLKRYCDFKFEYIKESNQRDKSSTKALCEEEARLQKIVTPGQWNILCDDQGESLTSTSLAQKFSLWTNRGNSHFNFLIGGAYGVSDTVKQQANYILSLSRLTLTHQMVRLLLIEQIYRSFTIIKGENYHH